MRIPSSSVWIHSQERRHSQSVKILTAKAILVISLQTAIWSILTEWPSNRTTSCGLVVSIPAIISRRVMRTMNICTVHISKDPLCLDKQSHICLCPAREQQNAWIARSMSCHDRRTGRKSPYRTRPLPSYFLASLGQALKNLHAERGVVERRERCMNTWRVRYCSWACCVAELPSIAGGDCWIRRLDVGAKSHHEEGQRQQTSFPSLTARKCDVSYSWERCTANCWFKVTVGLWFLHFCWCFRGRHTLVGSRLGHNPVRVHSANPSVAFPCFSDPSCCITELNKCWPKSWQIHVDFGQGSCTWQSPLPGRFQIWLCLWSFGVLLLMWKQLLPPPPHGSDSFPSAWPKILIPIWMHLPLKLCFRFCQAGPELSSEENE